MSVVLEEDIEVTLREAFDDVWVVIIHNDDNVTFDHVVLTLVDVLGITQTAASNHAYTAHTQGHAVVAAMSEDEAKQTAKVLRGRGVPASAAEQ